MTDGVDQRECVKGRESLPKGVIPWAGGECPVPLDSRPTVFFNDGGVQYDTSAGTWVSGPNYWKHEGSSDNRIIGYKPDPNYTPPIDWQARAEEAEAKIVELTRRTPLERAQDITPEKLGALANWCSDKYEKTCLSGAAGLDFIAEISKSRDELADLRAKAEKLATALRPFPCECSLEGYGRCASAEWMPPSNECANFHARAALAEWEERP